MSTPLTNLHAFRVLDQIRQTLINTQRDMIANAKANKLSAQAQSPSVVILAQFVADCAASYLAHLQWIIDLRNDSVKEQRLLDALAKWGWAESDVVDVVTALRAPAVALRDAPKTTYVQIISACDAVLAAVDAPQSLWPE